MSKKSFVNANPAMAFISMVEGAEDFSSVTEHAKQKLSKKHHQKEEKKVVKTVPMKKNPEFIETKSKRVQMLIQPSLYNEIKEEAKRKGVSVNEMMHEILKSYVDS
ncbi:hypothetical protein QE177_15380 (plasmid) [Arsenophonus sp. aPb]|uniref:hypothetical protein n=1 Tax=Arsenophonus sp. aPb TaxID=3041619 RepID=UPI00246980DF|nr:hypothetical protein [Arsenophonus sp. aPb]WGL99937.1 hypothetical protein QE177_15380 [Arsenophonus sp. aPb]